MCSLVMCTTANRLSSKSQTLQNGHFDQLSTKSHIVRFSELLRPAVVSSGGRADLSRNDGRALVGQMLAYDKHMNFVLAECEEFRTVKVGLRPGIQLDIQVESLIQ